MIRFRALLIACGYPDGNDCDALRRDPAFKMAVGRLPESGADLCSQPTISRLENLPGPIALTRMMAAMIDLFCDSFAQVPERIVLDIDDAEDEVHGGQQLALFNAHYDSHCFLPIHIYEATTGKPVVIFLRPGKTPDGTEVARVLRHVIRQIRARWPRVLRNLLRPMSASGFAPPTEKRASGPNGIDACRPAACGGRRRHCLGAPFPGEGTDRLGQPGRPVRVASVE